MNCFVGYGPVCFFPSPHPSLLTLWHNLLLFYPLFIPFQLWDFLFLECDRHIPSSGLCTSFSFRLEYFPLEIHIAVSLTPTPAVHHATVPLRQSCLLRKTPTFGSYWFLEEIGKSNTSKSNLPKHNFIGKHVAVKIIDKTQQNSASRNDLVK